MMHPWISLRHFLTLSAPLLRGPATRRLQQRRQQLLQKQAEQRTPTPKPATSGVTGANISPLNWKEPQQEQQQQQGLPKRTGAGHYADPMRPPEAVEGGNAAHTQFIRMHREGVQQRVVQQLIALRKQRQQSQQPEETPTGKKRGGDAPPPSAEAASELPLALAEVYVHHEHGVRQLTPRPHAFVEAHVKDLMAGAAAAANPLYRPSVPLGDDGECEAAEGPPSTGPSEAQLSKIANRVRAPGIALVHEETEAALAQMMGSSTSRGSPEPQDLDRLSEPAGGHSSERWQLETPVLSDAQSKPDPSSLLGGSGALEPWETPRGSRGPAEIEGAPSLVVAGASRQMLAELRARGRFRLEAETEGSPSSPDVALHPAEGLKSSVGRSRSQRGTARTQVAEADVAPFWGETRKATAQAEKAQEALLGDATVRDAYGAPLRGRMKESLWGDFVEGEALFPDAFADSRETKEHPQLSSLWEAEGARCGVVRDCRVPIDFRGPGSTLAAYGATRSGCSLFDVSFRRLWEVEGRDRLAYVDLVASCDLQRQMRIGDAQPALLLDSKGLVLDDCLVAKSEKKVEIWGSGHAAWHVFEYLAELANFCRKSGMDINLQPSAKTCVLALQGPLAMRRFLQQAERALAPRTQEGGISSNANISVSLCDARGTPMSLEETARLPFMSTWGLELTVKMNSTNSQKSPHKVYFVSCLRAGLTGEDGIEFALEAPAALALARLLLDDTLGSCGTIALPVRGSLVEHPTLGCFTALEMLRGEAGLPSMGVDIRSSHTAAQAGLARQLSLYKVRQRLFLGSDFIAKQLAVPPNVRRVAFLVGGSARLQRAEKLQQGLQLRQQQERQLSFFEASDKEDLNSCFPLGGCVVLSYCQRRPIGVVTSVAWSPLLQSRVAQGLVLYEFARHREAVPTKTPKWKITKILRGRRLRILVEGRVYRLPLVPHNYPMHSLTAHEDKEIIEELRAKTENQRRSVKTIPFAPGKKQLNKAASCSS